MNKKELLKTYKKIDSMDTNAPQKNDKKPIYQSEKDEKLIKDFHYAIFKKNLAKTQNDQSLKSLFNKEEWSEEDTQTLLKLLG